MEVILGTVDGWLGACSVGGQEMHSEGRTWVKQQWCIPKTKECAMLKQNVFCANVEAGVGEEEPIFWRPHTSRQYLVVFSIYTYYLGDLNLIALWL